MIIDSSGVLENTIKARKLIKGNYNKRIIFTNSPEKVDHTMVLGVNENKFNQKKHYLISSSICDATAIAPVSKIIDELFKIKFGYVTTLHPWLSYKI